MKESPRMLIKGESTTTTGQQIWRARDSGENKRAEGSRGNIFKRGEAREFLVCFGCIKRILTLLRKSFGKN